MASDRRAPLILGSFPSLSSISALDATPISVPSVSNISTNRNANMMVYKVQGQDAAEIHLKEGGRHALDTETAGEIRKYAEHSQLCIRLVQPCHFADNT